MITYNHIIKKMIGINEDNKTVAEIKTENIIFLQLYFVLNTNIVNNRSIKYNFLKSMILENVFLNENQKELLISMFEKIIRTYNAFSRLAYIYKFKKAVYQIRSDLCMNDLETEHKHTIIIFQNKNKYLFSLYDITRLIDNALSNSYLFFAQPKEIKNPYNNVPFNKSTLYNLYFFLKPFKMSELFEKYFKTGFELNEFLKNYEYLIVKRIIYKFVNNTSIPRLLVFINEMIDDYNFTKLNLHRIIIDRDFPSDKLFFIMKPFLHKYLLSRYCLSLNEKETAHIEWYDKMKSFHDFNPHFGKKTTKIVKKYIYETGKTMDIAEFSFDCEYKKYNEL
jgi:hypothetical protein